MDPQWAGEHLQVIRTLMERSALYRRALAPVATWTGITGIAASIVPCFVTIHEHLAFVSFWGAVSLVALFLSLWLIRRQAMKEKEPIWSPPTRRVAEALVPGLIVGLIIGGAYAFYPHPPPLYTLPPVWMMLYGCALSAAGFFVQRGIKAFGYLFIFLGLSGLLGVGKIAALQTAEAAHWMMGGFFGVLHLLYGLYLYITERRTHAS